MLSLGIKELKGSLSVSMFVYYVYGKFLWQVCDCVEKERFENDELICNQNMLKRWVWLTLLELLKRGQTKEAKM